MNRGPDLRWVIEVLLAAKPAATELSVSDWAEKHVRLVGSARSETFRKEITPWMTEPLDRADDGETRMITIVKPVQGGGSAVGEAALCRWIAVHNTGDIQYNWEDDDKASERWEKRIEKILKACKPVMDRWPPVRHKAKIGLVYFGHCNLTVQGVFSEANVASDSIRFQINEEIHNWEAGRLAQAWNRTTAFWNSVVLNISNAGVVNDQLHLAFSAGTMQEWQVKCPGCGEFHAMRIRWDPKRPALGGLRYDADGCRRGDDYDYLKMLSSIRYQMPCGFPVQDDPAERRRLSLSGIYSEPTNRGALLDHRSYRLEAAAVDYIPFQKLIQEKHEALRALKYGDPEPYKRYCQERECRFWDPEDRPILGRVNLISGLRKNRDGLPDRAFRFFALDRQQGELVKGELPHWWLVIRDAKKTGQSRLVFEGKLLTDEDAIGVLREHGVIMRHGVADSGDDTTHVYQFCLRHGINAIKGGSEAFFRHEVIVNGIKTTTRRIFSVEKPLHSMVGAPPTKEYRRTAGGILVPHPDEPLFWFYSKNGIRDRLAWLRGGGEVPWESPADVSDDYKAHMEAEELQIVRSGKSRAVEHVWVQLKKRNDLFVCECYVGMLMEMAGIIGERTIRAPAAEEDKPDDNQANAR